MIYNEGEVLMGTIKRDGSSITVYYRIDPITKEIQQGICSRSMEKKLDQQYISNYKDENGVLLSPYFNKEIQTKGWKNPVTEEFLTTEEVLDRGYEEVVVEVRDKWVDITNEFGYLDKLTEYCEKYNVQLALRGELIGQGNKGSGNKANNDSRGNCRVVWFGVDDITTVPARRLNYSDEHNLKKVCEELGLEYTQSVIEGSFDYKDVIRVSKDIFKDIKEKTGVTVEGIVFRTMYSNRSSFKYINPAYDAKA